MQNDWAAIVVAYNPGQEFHDCLEALLLARPTEVVVWDNSVAGDAKRNFGDYFADVRFEGDGKNYGYGAANNMAVRSLTRNVQKILLLNPDCIVSPTLVPALQKTLSIDHSIAAVAPAMVYPGGIRGISGGPFPSLTKELLALTRIDDMLPARLRARLLSAYGNLRVPSRRHRAPYGATLRPTGPVETEWISGFCMFWDIAAFNSLGGFDERFFLYFEDVDICWRARESGYRVLVNTDVEALHFESSSTSRAGKGKHYWRGLATYFQARGKPVQRAVASLVEGAFP